MALSRIGGAAAAITLAGALAACAGTVREAASDGALLEANRAYDRALLAGDAAALDALYLDDFIYIGPQAVVRDKVEQIRALTARGIDILSGASIGITIRRPSPDVAILIGLFRGRVSMGGSEFPVEERYSTVWVLRDGAWRLALEHGSVIEAQP